MSAEDFERDNREAPNEGISGQTENVRRDDQPAPAPINDNAPIPGENNRGDEDLDRDENGIIDDSQPYRPEDYGRPQTQGGVLTPPKKMDGASPFPRYRGAGRGRPYPGMPMRLKNMGGGMYR